ncbi:hypothetical protein FJ422_17595 [Mesorhizobium sp. B2-6-3]|uniref:hypothetical protein n=1 Tax=Mesorhizobium sp. B2-6-3 TaxID=2589914 RepID=UPI00112D0496|nr:hypothetical protein [Mesorhizobium sp. B2-6-3]TPJ84076.1 hypothetical protein FJ422_17595 [Mesorhizobium sp. B2-6-3]
MNERLTARLAYQRGWQVVDGSTVLATFATKEGAFQYLVDRGARVHLQWRRTKIGGQEPPYDFAAEFQSESVGRIKKELQGPSAGRWYWYQGSSKGSIDTKGEAVFEVERAYTRIVVKADWPK